MKKTLGSLFEEATGPTVEYEGLTVHGVVRRHVTKPGRFLVRCLKAVQEPIQSLSIDMDTGKLIVPSGESPRVLIRFDTAPDVVLVKYHPSRNGGDLVLYNSWVDEKDSIDAWLNDSGMLVEETGNKMILRCSDGWGEPTFDDLIVEIEFLKD